MHALFNAIQSINAIFDIACIHLQQNQAESLSLSLRVSSLRLRLASGFCQLILYVS